MIPRRRRERARGAALVLVDEMHEDMEVWYPLLRLREAGFPTLVAGPAEDVYAGRHGYTVIADRSFDRVAADELEAIIVPGGNAAERLRHTRSVVALLHELDQANGILAATSSGIGVLADAGLLRGHRVACPRSLREEIVRAGGIPAPAGVVRSGRVITSRQLSDVAHFTAELLSALAFRKHLRTAPPRRYGAPERRPETRGSVS